MNGDRTTRAKVAKPHAHFEEPADIVIDPALSRDQKKKALDSMEQDARQLLDASSEGMTGGEMNKLHEILGAKDSLELNPVAFAYDVVVNDLRATLRTDVSPEERVELQHALSALEAVKRFSAIKADPRVVTADDEGPPMPGSEAEMDAEIALEKLDP